MKNILLSTSLMIFILMTGFVVAPNPHVDTYKLDTKASTLEWNAKKLTGEHDGTIQFINGSLNDDHGSYTGSFKIDMKSINVTDLEGNYKAKLEKHLKSPDFFDVEKHSVSKLVITSIKASPKAEGMRQVSGNLTIKGITNEITFDCSMKNKDGKLTFSGEMVVDRSKFDVRYGSKTFFADIGDKMIYDDFTLKFNVVLAK